MSPIGQTVSPISKIFILYLRPSIYLLIIDMKITSAIYLVFTATLFLLLQIICLYRNCINNLTKPTLIAFKLLNAGDFMKQPMLPHAAVLKSVQAQKANLKPDIIAVHIKVELSLNMTDFYALRTYAGFCGFILLFCLAITISTRKTKADMCQNKPCVLTKCLLDNDTTSTG